MRCAKCGNDNREGISDSRMGLRREAAAHETQQIDLRIARKDKTLEKAVHPGSFICSSTVQWVILAEARHGAHDAVKLENIDPAVGAECGWYGAKWMCFQKCCVLRSAPVNPTLPVVDSPGCALSSVVNGRASKSQSQLCSSLGEAPMTSTSTPLRRAAMVAFQIRGLWR